MTNTQRTMQAVLVTDQAAPRDNEQSMRIALFDAAGNPVTNVVTAATMVLTGYTIAGAAAALAPTDTLNVALGKLEKNASVLQTGANVTITGYTIGAVALAALSATDTVNQALGKLEKRVADLEAA